MAKKKLLIFTEYFLPAKKGGGPVSSIRNIIDLLHEELEIRVVCFNHDMNSTEMLDGINSDEWNNWDNKAQVFYASKLSLSREGINRIVSDFAPNTIYLNAIFVYQFVVFPIWASKNIDAKVVIAPRGMLQESALNQKSFKKSIYLNLLKKVVFNKSIVWHSTNEKEKQEIFNTVGSKNTFKISNVPVAPQQNIRELTIGALRIISVSLNTRMKNIHFLLKVLKVIKTEIEFDIYGPIKDVEYWNECKTLINEIPKNIKVTYKGEVNPEDVTETISKYNLFVLPTLGENFGHAIFESFACGVPVLISDRTPWVNLENKNIGFDLTLDESLWVKTIESLEIDKLESMRSRSLEFAKEYYSNGNFKELYLELLNN